jgi:hypothetical protein
VCNGEIALAEACHTLVLQKEETSVKIQKQIGMVLGSQKPSSSSGCFHFSRNIVLKIFEAKQACVAHGFALLQFKRRSDRF